MTKKAFTLMELLVSLLLITTIIAAMITMSSQSLSFFDNKSQSDIEVQAVSIAMLRALHNKKDESFFITDLVKFDNQKIERSLKDIKFEVKTQKLEPQTLYEETPYALDIEQMNYHIFNQNIQRNYRLMELQF